MQVQDIKAAAKAAAKANKNNVDFVASVSIASQEDAPRKEYVKNFDTYKALNNFLNGEKRRVLGKWLSYVSKRMKLPCGGYCFMDLNVDNYLRLEVTDHCGQYKHSHLE